MTISKFKFPAIILGGTAALLLIIVGSFRTWLASQYRSPEFATSIEQTIMASGIASGSNIKVSPGQITGLFGVKFAEIRLSSTKQTTSEFVVVNTVIRPNLLLTPITKTIPFTLTLAIPPSGVLSVEGKLQFDWGFAEIKILQTRILLQNTETSTIRNLLIHTGAPDGLKKALALLNSRINGQAFLEEQDLRDLKKGSGNVETTFTKTQFGMPQFSRFPLDASAMQIIWKNGSVKTPHPWRLSAKVLGQSLQAAINYSAEKAGVTLEIVTQGPVFFLASLAGLLNCPLPAGLSTAPLLAAQGGNGTVRFLMSSPESGRPFKCSATAGGRAP